MEAANPLQKYIGIFANLHRNKHRERGPAPHKPVFLLAFLDEIACGHIQQNRIPLSPELIARFHSYWEALVHDPAWRPRMVYPFRYLVQDGVWELQRNGSPLSTKQMGDPTSLRQLSSLIDAAALQPDLWTYILDNEARTALRRALLTTYFPHASLLPVHDYYAPINYAAERLRQEAKGRFRVAEVRERAQNDQLYLRHTLFPRVIKELYDERCAVCRLRQSSMNESSVVDAAHIMPFHLFHNDDPRNGISLCKNHHWGFDNGLFAVDENYRLLVSSYVQVNEDYLLAHSRLHVPSAEMYWPAPEALRWHREHVFGKDRSDSSVSYDWVANVSHNKGLYTTLKKYISNSLFSTKEWITVNLLTFFISSSTKDRDVYNSYAIVSDRTVSTERTSSDKIRLPSQVTEI